MGRKYEYIILSRTVDERVASLNTLQEVADFSPWHCTRGGILIDIPLGLDVRKAKELMFSASILDHLGNES